MAVGTKVLNTLGVIAPGKSKMVKVAVAGATLWPLSVTNAPAGIVFTCGPSQSVVVTPTFTVQEPFAGIEPPVKVTFDVPLRAVSTPPQVFVPPPIRITSRGN
jgi:hypothetical protein